MDLTTRARAYQFGIRPVIVYGAGLKVLAARDPDRVEAVIAHELGHVINGDVLVYPVLILILVDVAFGAITFAVPGLLGDESARAPLAVGGSVIRLALFTALVRRREYLADAVGAGHVRNKEAYLLMIHQMPLLRSWFHPFPLDRLKALTQDNPVLRTNWLFVILAALLAPTLWGYHLRTDVSLLGDGLSMFLVLPSLIVSSVLLLLAAANEVGKGSEAKHICGR